MSSPDDNPRSDFVPRSFQFPNAYADEYMAFLTCEQWKVLTYAIRRILGFHKRQDRISLSQFHKGLKNDKGVQLDYGTGVSIGTCRKCLTDLVRYGLMVKLDDNNPANEGILWGLQWDSDLVNESAIMNDYEARQKLNESRIKKAHKIAHELSSSGGENQEDPEDMGSPVVTQQAPISATREDSPVVPQQAGLLSHNNTITSRKPEENQITTLEPNGSGASNGIPISKKNPPEKNNKPARREAPKPVRREAPVSNRLTPQQLMVGALCRVFQVDASLNGARYGRLARDLLNGGYKPVEILLWYSPEEALPDIRSFYGDEAVDAIDNHCWYYKFHWAWHSTASIPNESLLRQSIQHARIGHQYEIFGEKEGASEESRILSLDEMKKVVEKMIQGDK